MHPQIIPAHTYYLNILLNTTFINANLTYALRHISFLISLVLMLAVGLFYSCIYPYHLHFMEQVQMFLFTKEYLLDFVSIPGGVADYMGRFLTQFFHITWAGASIMALLFGLMYIGICKALRLNCVKLNEESRNSAVAGLFIGAVALLPMRFIGMYACDENAMPAVYIAIIISLFGSIAVSCFSQYRITPYLTILVLPLLYWAVGPMCILFALLSSLMMASCHKLWQALVISVVAILLPGVAHSFVDYPIDVLYRGIGYFRFREVFYPLMWFAAGIIFVLAVAARFVKSVPNLTISSATLVVFALLMAHGVNGHAMKNMEVVKMYDELAAQERWDDILTESRKRMPIYPACVANINLALIMTERIGAEMFDYYQPGEHALLPKHEMNFERPMAASKIYYKLNWTNMSQWLCFEAQESIPNSEKSAHCYKRLAQTHIVRGEYKAARKYLEPLTHTLFYKDWALGQMKYVEDETLVMDCEEYAQMRICQYRGDYFYGDNMKIMLADYCTSTMHNRYATLYLKALCLLQNDLDLFHRIHDLDEQFMPAQQLKEPLPRYFEQAMALYLMKNDMQDQLPKYRIQEKTIDHMKSFMEALENGAPKDVMYRNFGNTYWFYYTYNEKANADEK